MPIFSEQKNFKKSLIFALLSFVQYSVKKVAFSCPIKIGWLTFEHLFSLASVALTMEAASFLAGVAAEKI